MEIGGDKGLLADKMPVFTNSIPDWRQVVSPALCSPKLIGAATCLTSS